VKVRSARIALSLQTNGHTAPCPTAPRWPDQASPIAWRFARLQALFLRDLQGQADGGSVDPERRGPCYFRPPNEKRRAEIRTARRP
jgi:hypothetical protein